MESTFACLLGDTENGSPSLSQRRNQLYADFVQRTQKRSLVEASPSAVAELLNTLLEKNMLFFRQTADNQFEIYYGPSSAAAEQLSESIPLWPDKISTRFKKSLRSSYGAICRLEIEGGEGFIEVFVTDWSSCTAACAVALHAYHPIVRKLKCRGEKSNYFTGLYVRNPLTGDLMSVWVADWVKPDFGTGAVLVNPAHNRTDLEFARSVGLPIRFALSLQALVDEHARPVPPVVKTGFAIRTRFVDGKPAEQVHNETINILLRKGSAVLHNDRRLSAQLIARLDLVTAADTQCQYWNRRTGEFIEALSGATGDSDVLAARLVCTPVLLAGATVVLFKPGYLQVDAVEQKNSLLVLAAMIHDLAGPEGFVPLELLELVEYAGQRDLDETMKLVLLVGEAPEKILVVRKALLEQVETFQEGIKKVQHKLADEGELPPTSVYKALDQADPVGAFKELNRWQKSIINSDLEIHAQQYRSVLGALGVESVQ